MAASATSVFISRIRGLPVLDAPGTRSGRCATSSCSGARTADHPGSRAWWSSCSPGTGSSSRWPGYAASTRVQVVISGVVNTRRFERRESEILVIDDLFDLRRGADRPPGLGGDLRRRDAARPHPTSGSCRRWRCGKRGAVGASAAGATSPSSTGPRSRSWRSTAARAPTSCWPQMEDMKAADVARELHEMSPERRAEVASALDDHKLADALEELPEDEQVQLISELDTERAADILEEMDPDDAADLIAELAPEMAEVLLARMEPEEAKDVRRLLSYAEFTAGGMMTPEPVILPPDATVADALGSGPRRGADPGAGLHGLRLPVAAGDPDRAVRRRGALPAAAARAAVDPGLGPDRHRAGDPDRPGEPARRQPLLRDLQPGERAGGRQRPPADRRGHGRRRA